MTITMTNILNFENVTSVSQSLYGRRRRFKHLVLREYGQFDQNNRFDMATGETFPDVAVTHIFPYRWQKFLPQFTSLNEIDDVGNGLMLYQPVAWAFNRAKLCIQVDSAGRMVFHLFDEELRDVRLASKARSLQAVAAQDDEVLGIGGTELDATFGDLHGQAVRFPVDSTVRPSKRLLALHAYAAGLQARSLSPNVQLTIPQYNFLDDETTGQALYFFIDLWRKAVRDGPPVSKSCRSACHAILTCCGSLTPILLVLT
jgi:HNH endonuclease